MAPRRMFDGLCSEEVFSNVMKNIVLQMIVRIAAGIERPAMMNLSEDILTRQQ